MEKSYLKIDKNGNQTFVLEEIEENNISLNSSIKTKCYHKFDSKGNVVDIIEETTDDNDDDSLNFMFS